MKLPLYVETVDAATCTRCAGACCKAGPGTAAPEDFGPDRADRLVGMTAALASGRWVAELYRGPFILRDGLRLSSTAAEMVALRPAITSAGACVFLAPDGCTIFATRPTGCRTLVPAPSWSPGDGSDECHQPREAGVALLQAWLDHDAETRAAVAATGSKLQKPVW